MKNPTTKADSDDFRIVDLFSPGDDVFGRSTPAHPAATDPSRMATADMPPSFMFTNPLFERSGPGPEVKND